VHKIKGSRKVVKILQNHWHICWWGLQWESCWICAWCTNLCTKLLEQCGSL